MARSKLKESKSELSLKEKKPSLRDSLNKQIITKFGDVVLPTTIAGKLTTGWHAFDKFCPLELGSIILMYGGSQSGKSLMMMKMGAAAQEKGGLFVCFNTEAANRDSNFISKVTPNLNYDKILFYQPDTVEYIFDCIELIIENTPIDSSPIFIGIDSISSCATKHEMDTDMDKVDMSAAKLISKGLRKVNNRLSKKPIILCLLSQTRSKIGGYVTKDTHTGGASPYFYASTVILLKRRKSLFDGKDGEYVNSTKNNFEAAVAQECIFKLEKSRYAPGGAKMSYIVHFKDGIGNYEGLLDSLVYEKIIIKTGSWYCYGDEKFYRKDFVNFIEERLELLES